MKWFDWFLKSGSASARLVRTLAEVGVAWIIANIGDITGLFGMNGTVKALVISGVTVILTAVLGFINDNADHMMGIPVEEEDDEKMRE